MYLSWNQKRSHTYNLSVLKLSLLNNKYHFFFKRVFIDCFLTNLVKYDIFGSCWLVTNLNVTPVRVRVKANWSRFCGRFLSTANVANDNELMMVWKIKKRIRYLVRLFWKKNPKPNRKRKMHPFSVGTDSFTAHKSLVNIWNQTHGVEETRS